MIREGVPPERRGSAFGTIGMAASAAAASGPPIGGLLVHWFGWQSIFWMNVPVVAIAIGSDCAACLTPTKPGRRRVAARFDIAGSSLFAATLAALIVVPTS